MEFENYRTKLSPSYYHKKLMRRTKKRLAFSPGVDFISWQKRLRKQFLELIGHIDKEKCPVKFKILEERIYSNYILKKILFTTNPDVMNIAYLLIPRMKKTKFPAMICLQGHTPGAHISIGKAYTKHDKEYIAGDRDFAIQAVKNGFVALAIEQRCFGERREKLQKSICPYSTCLDAEIHALMLGTTLVAERVADVMRGIDLLCQIPYVDKNRIGCIGHSAGGTATYYTSCVDRRIKLAVSSCAFCTYEGSPMNVSGCMCRCIPRILNFCSMEDLAGLIAPRYLIIVAGKKDSISPIAEVRKGFKTVKQIYQEAGVPMNCKLIVGSGGHRFYAGLTWPVINSILLNREQEK